MQGDPGVEVGLADWKVHLGQSVEANARVLICLCLHRTFLEQKSAQAEDWSPSLSGEARSRSDMSSGCMENRQCPGRGWAEAGRCLGQW